MRYKYDYQRNIYYAETGSGDYLVKGEEGNLSLEKMRERFPVRITNHSITIYLDRPTQSTYMTNIEAINRGYNVITNNVIFFDMKYLKECSDVVLYKGDLYISLKELLLEEGFTEDTDVLSMFLEGKLSGMWSDEDDFVNYFNN